MAIPLIQNVEKQDINTSIIAIKKELQTLQDKETVVDIDLSDYVKKDDVADVVEADNLNPVTSNAVAQALEDLPQYGTPLGTWASFETDYAPNIEWLQGGTTFNPNTYPALAMYLGGNTVPERYDHDRPSDYERFDLTTTDQVMAYDGFLLSNYFTNSQSYTVIVNDVAVSAQNTTDGQNITMTIPFKAGDRLKRSGGSEHGTFKTYVKYYKHPLFIKATPTSSDSDYEGTLNAIREFYVRNNTYSTEERLTGGVWIDGKPIYRKAVLINITINGNWGNTNIPNPYYTGYTGDIERIITCTCTDGQATSLQVDMSPTYQFFRVATGYGKLGTWTGVYLLLEYTKSTDS